MKIVLLRHGRPEMPSLKRLKAREMRAWIGSYDAAGVDKSHPAPARAIMQARGCQTVVCSDLPRSIQSAEALNLGQVHCSDPLFREAVLPFAEWDSPRLSPYVWAALFRVLWLLGRSGNSESLAAARTRAAACAEKLVQLAAVHGSVLLIGHGLMNHLIAGELLATGWRGPSNPGKRHWSFGIYVRG